MQVSVKNLDIHYETYGEGEDVLFLHGWGCPGQNYKIITDFVSKKYRVTVPDFPGFGESEMPQTPFAVEDYADFVAEFVNAVGIDPKIIMGHSHGGRVALYLSAHTILRPEKLVLLGAAGVKLKPSLYKKLRLYAFKTVKWFLSVPLWKKPCEPLLEKARNYFGSSDYNSSPAVLRSSLVKLVNYDITPELGKIPASTLLIYGENDTATPLACARVLEKGIPDAGLCVIKDADHFAFAEKPFEVNAIIGSFLTIK